MEYKNMDTMTFFKKLYKEIKKTLKENPNYLINVDIKIRYGGDTVASADIIIDKSTNIIQT